MKMEIQRLRQYPPIEIKKAVTNECNGFLIQIRELKITFSYLAIRKHLAQVKQ